MARRKRLSSSSSSESDSDMSWLCSESSDSEEELCDYEKRRLDNIRRNQQMMRSLGLPVKNALNGDQKRLSERRPSRKKPARKKAVRKVKEESDSEEEWQPWMEEQKQRPRRRDTAKTKPPLLDPLTKKAILTDITNHVDKRLTKAFQPPAKKPSSNARQLRSSKPRSKLAASTSELSDDQTSEESFLSPPPLPESFDTDLSDDEEFWGFPPEAVVNDIQSKFVFDFQLNDRGKELFGEEDKSDTGVEFKGFTLDDLASTEIPPVDVHRYPRRGRGQKTYCEEEISDDDDYLYCEDCEEIYDGDCPIHGPLRCLDHGAGWDEDSKAYTTVPVPAQLTVKTSDIISAGLGIFAKEFIPRGLKVGPYQGTMVLKEDMDDIEDTSYMWEIHRDGQKPYFLDGRDASRSNWLRFINCARHEEEQNMVAFQYKGKIYYRTFKHLYPGSELLVWYGREYAEELGIPVNLGMDPSYKCQGCGSTFVENRSFQVHLKHSAECAKAHPQVFKCFKCHQTFSELYQLQDHIRRHETIIVQQCKHKQQNERLHVGLSDTGQEDTGDRDESTHKYCGGTTKLYCPTDLQTHTQKPFECQHCGKGFSTNRYLDVHIRTHTGEKPYKCQHCGKGFSRNDYLQMHIRTHTGDKPYKCQHCGKGFSRNGSLQMHILTHTGEKPYKCQHCGKGFSQNGSLQMHILTHTGEKPYKCQHCGKGFSTNSNLQRHIRTHTGDKPYKCQHCGKGFSQSSSLQMHIRTHTRDKPYKCQHCGKGFSTNSNLQMHIRTHTGDKPYKCQHCGKGFSQSSSLQMHIRTHTRDKPYKCQHCGKGFSQSSSLQIHIRTHTGEVYN